MRKDSRRRGRRASPLHSLCLKYLPRQSVPCFRLWDRPVPVPELQNYTHPLLRASPHVLPSYGLNADLMSCWLGSDPSLFPLPFVLGSGEILSLVVVPFCVSVPWQLPDAASLQSGCVSPESCWASKAAVPLSEAGVSRT